MTLLLHFHSRGCGGRAITSNQTSSIQKTILDTRSTKREGLEPIVLLGPGPGLVTAFEAVHSSDQGDLVFGPAMSGPYVWQAGK